MSGGDPADRSASRSTALPAALETELLARLDAAESTEVEAEFCRRCPEHAAEIRQFLRDYRRLGTTEEPRRVVADYAIDFELGRGAMGVVYAATQRSLGRTVALKVLPRAFALDESRLARFRAEVAVLARLHHDHIVRVFDAGEDDGVPFLAMELVAGASLAEAVGSLAGQRASELTSADLDRALRLPPAAGITPTPRTVFDVGHLPRTYVDRVLTLGAELCDALAYAHAEGVIHRDIKPQNILVDRQGRAKLLDFGLARGPDGESLGATLAGTPVYMSPEQILAGRVTLDHRTDVYSLAATLYELLTLRPPFVADSLPRLFRRIQWDDPPAMAKLNPALSHDVVAVIDKAMAKNPDRRYADAAAFGADLRRLLRCEAVAARGTTTLARLRSRLVRHRWRVALAAVVLIAAGAAAVAVAGVRAAERAALAAERAETQRQWLARLGRVDALCAAGEIGVAARELEGVDGDVPASLREEVAAARAVVAAAIDAAIARQRAVLAAEAATAEQLEAAASALSGVGRTFHRSDEVETLRAAAAERAAGLRETELFRSADASVRKLVVLAWAADRHAGRPVSEAREAAFRALLAAEQEEEVLRPALASVARLGFAPYAATLRRRLEGAEPRFAVHIALAAGLAGETSWLDLCRPALSLPADPTPRGVLYGGRGDVPRLTAWDDDLPWRWSGVFRTDGALGGFAWDREFLGGGGSGRDSPERTIAAARFLLGDRRLWTDLQARIGDMDGLRAALAVAELRDDPRLAATVHRALLARGDVGDLDVLLGACRLVSVHGLEPPLPALDRAVAAFDQRSAPATLALVVAELFDRPTIQAWALDHLQDPLTPDASRRALYDGFAGRLAGSLVPLRASWIATRPGHASWLGRERRRSAVVAGIDDALRAGPAAAWLAGQRATAPAARVSPLMAAIFVGVRLADDLKIGALAGGRLGGLRTVSESIGAVIFEHLIATGAVAMERRFGGSDDDAAAGLEVVPLTRVRRARELVADESRPAGERRGQLLGLLADPEPVVQRAAALALAELGRARDGEAVLRQTVELYGREPEVLRALALAAAERDDLEAAATWLREIVAGWEVEVTDPLFADPRLDPVRARVAASPGGIDKR